jgi:hypothetical protein
VNNRGPGCTASDLGEPEVFIPGSGFVPYGPGNFIPHSIYCNVGRCLIGVDDGSVLARNQMFGGVLDTKHSAEHC